MSLGRRGPNEDWETPAAADRARVLARESPPLGLIAVLAAALVTAYLVLSGTSPADAGAASVDLATTCADPGYDATLLSPSVPGSSDTYTYVIDGCQPDDNVIGVHWQDIGFVKFSGCWQIEDVKDVRTTAGSVEMIAPGYVVVTGISDDDLPLTVEIIFPISLVNGEERTWIWVHTGPDNNDGWTFRTGGPFCEALPPGPTPSPTPPVTELTIVKTGSPDEVAVDDTLAYTVTVNNIGAIAASNVAVTDELPDHVSLISSTPSQGSCDGTTCQLGDIAAGEAAVISYIVLVNESAVSPLLNTACVTSSTAESDLTNNCDEKETRLKTPLGAMSTPDGVPTTGGGSPDGESTGLPLLLVLGIGLAVIGGVAGLAARRRMTNR